MEGPALSSDDLCDILEEIQKEQERVIKIVTAASFRIEGRKQREKVAPVVRRELRRRLEEAQEKVIASFDVSIEEVEQTWSYFSGAWEQDHEDEEAARVVEAGWRVKSVIAKHIMNKELALSAVESMKDACLDEMPDVMSRLQERLDQAGVADMSPQSAMPVLQQLVQVAAQEIMRGASSNRMEKEWGMDYSQLQRRLHEYSAQDKKFKQMADQVMTEFEEACVIVTHFVVVFVGSIDTY